MATVTKKKTPAKAKVPVVPAKTIATTAAKAVVSKAAVVKAPAKAVKTAVAKPVAKPALPATKIATKPAPKAKASTAKKKAAIPKAAIVVPVVAKEKIKKPKLVRDSFTMPELEYAVLGEVKKACIAAGIEVKKSQLLRVGLVLLKGTPVSSLKSLIEGLQTLKAGRPKLG